MKNAFFEARSFAVVGASDDKKKVGHIIFQNLMLQNKTVFPVNSKHEKVLGHKCYKTISDISDKIDCVVIAVPSKFVLEILNQMSIKKIKCAVIISAGFSEAGNFKLENEIIDYANKSGIKCLGPNTFGFINTPEKINTTFFEGKTNEGNIAFISQSGAIGSAVLDQNKKFSGFVSLGNSAQIDFSDFIEYFAEDSKTKIITLYMESLKKEKGERFFGVCKNCQKPIIVLKSGKTQSGQRAAASHTAAVASDNLVYSGIFQQLGIKEAISIKQLFDSAEIYSKYSNIKKACIVTNAGGAGVLTTDYCERNQIILPELPKNVKDKLDAILPASWSKNNPVDIIGDAIADTYEKTLKILEKENFFDFFIVILTPQYMSQPLETAKILVNSKKPVVACFIGGEQVESAINFLRENQIPVFAEPKEMCDALGLIV
ncbi:MAG: acetate--CoA ligase family protein [Nanoarchaeota archaeon]